MRATVQGRKLKVYVERTGKKEDAMILAHQLEMRTKGSYFDLNTSQMYDPLTQEDLEQILIKNPEFFDKRNAIGQLSDLVLYPVVRGKYQRDYPPYSALRDAGRLIDVLFDEREAEQRGIKYSCFDGF